MKAHLLYRNQNFNWKWALQAVEAREATRAGRQYRSQDFDRHSGLPWNEEALTSDLSLNTLFDAMARGDDCVFEIARKVMLSGMENDIGTIRYRQNILQDCLNQPSIIRELYTVAVEAMEEEKKHYFGSLIHYPDWVLRYSIELMEILLGFMKRLRMIADSHADKFASEGWTTFFAMLQRELSDEYFVSVQHHLKQLKFHNGVLLSAGLGKSNKGIHYVLRQPRDSKRGWLAFLIDWLAAMTGEPYEGRGAWLRRLFRQPPVLGFSLHPRDESGAKALAELRDRGIGLVANALGQSADHVRNLFGMLQAELAFYIGCMNLHEQLAHKGEPMCFPLPATAEERRFSFHGLYNVCLALNLEQRVVGNDAEADKKDLVIITGANSGGKSTFLCGIGLAQLMMQCGMFVPADSFCSSVCDGLFTHYKREEDAGMESGKFDEELSRMNDIVGHIKSHSMILLNESFAATNEREGSEIARQIVSALLDKGIKIVCVTHLYELAHGFHERNKGNVLFLRADRQLGGTRTFKLAEGEPLQTSFGDDLYNSIFGVEPDHCEIDNPKTPAGVP